MRIETSLTPFQIKQAAHSIGCRVYYINQVTRKRPHPHPHVYTCKLRVFSHNPNYRTYNPITGRNAGRHLPCWHGYRDFYVALFDLDPHAKITSGFQFTITYDGRDDFNRKYPDTANTPMGSLAYPYTLIEKCNHD